MFRTWVFATASGMSHMYAELLAGARAIKHLGAEAADSVGGYHPLYETQSTHATIRIICSSANAALHIASPG